MACGVTKGLPSRSPPIHEPKRMSCGRSQIFVTESGCVFAWVLRGESGGDLAVEDRQRVEEAGLVVVERHADLVADSGARAANVVGLPESGDLGDEVALQGFELRLGNGDAVELFEQVGDAAALEHDAAAGDLGRVRGEDGRDADAAKKRVGFVSGDAGLAQTAKRAAQIAALDGAVGGALLAELMREPAALAMVGFGQVDELEVEAEGARELVGGRKIEGADASERLLEMSAGRGWLAAPLCGASASRRAMAVRRRASTAS